MYKLCLQSICSVFINVGWQQVVVGIVFLFSENMLTIAFSLYDSFFASCMCTASSLVPLDEKLVEPS